MAAPGAALSYDWLGACRRSAGALGAILAAAAPGAERLRETGTIGEGGDRTLVLDQAAEDAVFGELERLHDDGARFTAISEERGIVDFGSPAVRVVIDPIDGSLNAKRGLPHHSISIAVADGPAMSDVVFGYVYDFGPGEEWRALRGEGAWLNDVRLDDVPPERRTPDGRLEIVAIESAAPVRIAASAEALMLAARRVRAIGSIAISLCQVAAGRVDAMASLGPGRAFDSAAAQLIVHESGGLVAFPGLDDPAGPRLEDLTANYPVVAARTRAGLGLAATIPATT